MIVAIVGNATEHGSAVLLGRRGKIRLAREISLASSAQVAGLLIPWSLSFLGRSSRSLSFRPIEPGALVLATALAGLVLAPGRPTRLDGMILLFAYAVVGVAFYYSANT